MLGLAVALGWNQAACYYQVGIQEHGCKSSSVSALHTTAFALS